MSIIFQEKFFAELLGQGDAQVDQDGVTEGDGQCVSEAGQRGSTGPG